MNATELHLLETALRVLDAIIRHGIPAPQDLETLRLASPGHAGDDPDELARFIVESHLSERMLQPQPQSVGA